MQPRTFHKGDFVIVTETQHFMAKGRKPRLTVWAGQVLIPSVIGEGWYVIRKLPKFRRQGPQGARTVHWTEMKLKLPSRDTA